VVGCLKSEELVSWEDVPESVRILFNLFFLSFISHVHEIMVD
jgi:hypothetical protein